MAMGGYDDLAALMTSDKGLSIFRSFKTLNAKNLLYLQAEIALREKELNDIMEQDRASKDKYLEKLSCSVRMLKGIPEPSRQWEKWLQVRDLLDKYNTAFAQHAQLLRLKPPHKHDLKIFRTWLRDNTFCATAVECHQWFGEQGENAKDLVTLYGRYDTVDSLTRWAFRVVVPCFDRLVVYFRRIVGSKKTEDIETGPVYYDDQKIIRVTRVISTITSAVIPASSMLVLYLVDDMITRLIIIIVYNIGFSIIIGLLAKARRVEVFAASTAFAAVQVAFITNFRD
ncbi:hypothetical protein BJX76DRAFT_364187 [Aspergillus varians]